MTITEHDIFDYEAWTSRSATLNKEFLSASPYPHLVLDNFLVSSKAEETRNAFPASNLESWTQYTHVNERKQAQTKRDLIPPVCLRAIDEMNSPRFIDFLESVSGIKNLLPDPDLQGGGLHQVKKGGFLNIHADFTSHPSHKNWARRINVLVYLNPNWKEEYGGHLELWDQQAKNCVKKVLPVFNRCVIFRTDPTSFHGHPNPLKCPEDWTRKSMALYYFTDEKEPVFTRSTEYRPLPSDSGRKKLAIVVDKYALRLFDYLKRRWGLSDRWAGSLLRKLFK